MDNKVNAEQTSPKESLVQPLDVDLANIYNPALARIVDEVRIEAGSTSHAYDRVHNRHNR